MMSRGVGNKKTNMQLITVHLPKPLVEGLERLVELGHYPSRSEAIRVAIRDLLRKELYARREKAGLMTGV